MKVERIGAITIYKRGLKYYLYYREGGISPRRRIDGNLAVARATAHKVADALAERRPSPIAFTRASPEKMVDGFLDAVANVQKLALRTQDRYRAALDRFKDFCQEASIGAIDTIQTCNEWQHTLFTILATYGLRVGELTHLLVDDVDFANDAFVVRSKPWMFWTVKTGRERRLPLLAGTKGSPSKGDRRAQGRVRVSE